MIATIVDTTALWQTALGSLVAGVGTAAAFSFAIVGATRFAEANRDGRGVTAALYGALAMIGLLLTAAAIVFAVIVMTSKG